MAGEKKESTIIAADTYIKGEMIFEKSATIQGKFDGRIEAKGDLTIADSAKCAAEVEAGNIIVDGTVEGNLTAAASITLTNGAKLTGDIRAERLVTAEGASISGHVMVGPQAAKQAPKAQPGQQPQAKGQQQQQRQAQQGGGR